MFSRCSIVVNGRNWNTMSNSINNMYYTVSMDSRSRHQNGF